MLYKQSNGLVNDFRGLSNELKTLRETYFGVNARLTEYHALHTRTRRSLIRFVGQAFSFLFGTVSEGDMGAIRRNLHVLRDNQVGLAHVVQESLSLINVSRTRIAENRQNFHSHPIKLVPDHVRDRRCLLHDPIVRLPLTLQFTSTLMTLVIHWITHLEVDRFTALVCVLGLPLLSPLHVIVYQSEQFVLLM